MAAVESEAMSTVCVAHLGSHLDQAATAVETLLAKAKAKVAALVMPGGRMFRSGNPVSTSMLAM